MNAQLRGLAVGGVLVFLAIVAVEHLIDSRLDPARHEISEYVHGPTGWLMTTGFLAWAVSLACTAALMGASGVERVMRFSLAAAALGMIVTACFATQTSAGHLPEGVHLSTSGRLHDIGSAVTSIALLATAVMSLRIKEAPRLRAMTVAVLVLVLPADGVLLAVGSEVGGIRQRLLVLAGCLWQLSLLATRCARAKNPGARERTSEASGASARGR